MAFLAPGGTLLVRKPAIIGRGAPAPCPAREDTARRGLRRAARISIVQPSHRRARRRLQRRKHL